VSIEFNHRGDSTLAGRPNDANIGENTVGQFSASDWKDFAKWAGGGDGTQVPKFHLEKDGSITFPSAGGADSGSKQSSSGPAGAGDGAARVASNLVSSSEGGPTAGFDPYNSREASKPTSYQESDGTKVTGNGHGFQQITHPTDPMDSHKTIIPGHVFEGSKTIK
jgi:hypothetical protein